VLAALVPEADVERTLASLAPYEVDPRVLTTKAGAIAELRHLFPEELQGTFALCTEGADEISIAIFSDGKPVALREVVGVAQASEARAQAILTTVAGIEKTLGLTLEQVIGVGCSPRTLEALAQSGASVVELRLDGAVRGEEALPISINKLAWAVGLLAGDLAARPIVNFRRGKYAYRARYDKLLQPVREELNYILFAVGAVVLFLLASFYHGSKTSSELDERILSLTREVSPGEIPPSGRELSFVQGKLDEIENQLRALGSLASLSPLGALREVAETLPAGTELESVSIGNSRITMTGTVSDIPAVGRLNGVFERKADRFCDVKVDSKGKSSGSSRVGFIAEIGMCE
jgi:hypothetical protein